MQEFSSISVSTYNPDELVGQLNEQVKGGWSVVAIVPTGSTVTAYLSRESDGRDANFAQTVASDAVEPDSDDFATNAAALADQTPSDHFEVAAATTPEPAPSELVLPAVDSTPEPEPVSEPAAAAAPAGWYADPSSRFELRYWDGGTWTEHVSRGGQQFTDPPVA